jgi:aquaporin Z
MQKYLAEFIGTFLFVFSIINAVHNAGALAGLAIGATLMVMVYAGGHISGAHYNPAVSLALLVRGRLSSSEIGPYVVAQLVGAALGAALARWMNGALPTAEAYSGKALAVAFVVEIIWTFALAWVVTNVATSKDHPGNHFYGLAIGFTVVAGALALGPLSGGAFNPAVGVGVAVAGGAAGNLWIHIIAPLLGGALAGYLFKTANPDDA